MRKRQQSSKKFRLKKDLLYDKRPTKNATLSFLRSFNFKMTCDENFMKKLSYFIFQLQNCHKIIPSGNRQQINEYRKCPLNNSQICKKCFSKICTNCYFMITNQSYISQPFTKKRAVVKPFSLFSVFSLFQHYHVLYNNLYEKPTISLIKFSNFLESCTMALNESIIFR